MWYVSLGARQAKLLRLGSGNTSAVGPTNQGLVVGSSVTFSAAASGTPPFSYAWRKNGALLGGQSANTITLNPVSLSDAGVYAVEVTGGNGAVTNTAVLTLVSAVTLTATITGSELMLSWPAGYTGWRLQTQTNILTAAPGVDWTEVIGSRQTNAWAVPIDATSPSLFFRLIYP
jgi:hypothetical protein